MNTAPQPSGPKGRSGLISAWAVLGMIACLSCVALVANSGYLTNLRSENHRCAQACALAAGRSLLSDDLLKPQVSPFQLDIRYQRARLAAKQINTLYVARADIPVLYDNHIGIGSLSRSESRQGTQFLQNSYRPHRIQVVLSNDATDQSAGRLFLSGMTGISKGRIHSRAVALLRNRLIGFCQSENRPMPLIPLAIPDDPADSTASGYWSSDVEARRGGDSWAWDEKDGIALRSADQLTEIIVSLKPDTGTADSAIWVSVFGNTDLQDLTESPSDSKSDARTAELTFPVAANQIQQSKAELTRRYEELRALVGHPRIFPLYDVSRMSSGTDSMESGSINLTRPIAARIMDIERRANDELQITFQPCVLSTSTAVMSDDPAVPENPYIWRIGIGSRN